MKIFPKFLAGFLLSVGIMWTSASTVYATPVGDGCTVPPASSNCGSGVCQYVGSENRISPCDVNWDPNCDFCLDCDPAGDGVADHFVSELQRQVQCEGSALRCTSSRYELAECAVGPAGGDSVDITIRP